MITLIVAIISAEGKQWPRTLQGPREIRHRHNSCSVRDQFFEATIFCVIGVHERFNEFVIVFSLSTPCALNPRMRVIGKNYLALYTIY